MSSRTAFGWPLLFVLLWSTGFVGAKYGLPYADPFIFLALRVAIAAVLLALIAVIWRAPIRLSAKHIAQSGLIGIALHGAYLGGVFYAISHGVSAGVAAVITSLQPVLVSVLGVRILGEKLSQRAIFGLFIGLGGVILVLSKSFSSATFSLAGICAAFIALLGSTSATLMQKKFGTSIPLLAGTSYQYLAAGLLLLLASLATGEYSIQWDSHFIAALIWLVLVLSVGAVLILLWLLSHSSASTVSSLFYLVPPATAIEAYFLFNEELTTSGYVGIAAVALGVWLVIGKK